MMMVKDDLRCLIQHFKIDNEVVQIDSREWNGIGGEEKEEEEEEDCIRRFTIMPGLQNLEILVCTKLKSVPNFLCTTPLQKLEIPTCPILEECFKRGTGEDWPKISHIPNIIIDYKYVQGSQECMPKPRHVGFSEL